MWTRLRNFITSMCLVLAPYIDVCRFGAPKEKSDLKQGGKAAALKYSF